MSDRVRLADFKTFLVHDGYRTFVFLKLYTDDGLTGVGEGSTEWNELAVEAAIRQMCGRLRGADPFQTEALWEQLYRDSYWRNDLIINSAISAIDQACWDLKGKKLGVPVYALLGGLRRERLRAYANAWYWGCTTPDDFARAARQVVAEGFTALKWDPFGAADMTLSAAAMRAAVDNVAAVRAAVGPDVDLCVEVHGRLAPAWAIEMARRLKPFDPFFYEEPVPPENFDALATVARAIEIPVATGERLTTKFLFRELLLRQAADIIQPDLCHAGGLTEVKKIAAMAEASYVRVAPHNATGPIGTAAAVQLDACIPNFLIQEYFVTQASWIDEVVQGAPRAVRGEIAVPDRPGLGVELDEAAALAHPFKEAWGGQTLFSAGWQAGLRGGPKVAGA
ncbi:MAG: galactonate dehydratase [Candidatus Rokuibacteriota bacterium]|nr:MAG: galactonate dehydratase [Candidatus Rokubacteria bacterium]